MIVDMLEYVKTRYKTIFKKLKYSHVPDSMVGKLEKQMIHCKQIMEYYASQDPSNYTFHMSEPHIGGEPFKYFMNSWDNFVDQKSLTLSQ